MIQDGNTDLQKEMKNTRNGNYIDKYKNYHIISVSLKCNLLFK